jgi:hypothetical protein
VGSAEVSTCRCVRGSLIWEGSCHGWMGRLGRLVGGKLATKPSLLIRTMEMRASSVRGFGWIGDNKGTIKVTMRYSFGVDKQDAVKSKAYFASITTHLHMRPHSLHEAVLFPYHSG